MSIDNIKAVLESLIPDIGKVKKQLTPREVGAMAVAKAKQQKLRMNAADEHQLREEAIRWYSIALVV